jgi:hypothetical protein
VRGSGKFGGANSGALCCCGRSERRPPAGESLDPTSVIISSSWGYVTWKIVNDVEFIGINGHVDVA